MGEFVTVGFWLVVALFVAGGVVSALWLGWREGKEAQAKTTLEKQAEEIRDEDGGVEL